MTLFCVHLYPMKEGTGGPIVHPCTIVVCSAQSKPSKSVFNIPKESNLVLVKLAFVHIAMPPGF